jgi:hypothetical protein
MALGCFGWLQPRISFVWQPYLMKVGRLFQFAIKNSGTTLDFTQTIIKMNIFFDNSHQIVPNNKSKSVSLFVHHNALWWFHLYAFVCGSSFVCYTISRGLSSKETTPLRSELGPWKRWSLSSLYSLGLQGRGREGLSWEGRPTRLNIML